MKDKIKDMIFQTDAGFEDTRAFNAIRQGLTMMIPLIVLGAMALMIKSLPIPAYQELLPKILDGKFVEFLDFIYGGTFQIFSVALAITTSVSYAMIKNTKLRLEWAVVNDCYILAIVTLIVYMGHVGVYKEGFSTSAFGTTNTFMAMFFALLSGWLYFRIREWKILNFIRRQEADVNGMYYIAVQSIIPAAIVVGIFTVGDILYSMIFHVESLQDGLIIIMEKVLSFFRTGFTVGIAILFFTHVMWFFGIHGSNVIDAVIQKNYTAIDGIHIYSKTFQDVFAIMGGCGAVLGLSIAILLFSRKKIMKNVAKLALPGVIFNISEVIVFGLPIIFNPIFFIPFLLVPIANFVVSYGAMYVGFVPKVVHQVEWTAPIFLSGYQATGSILGSVLQLVCLIMDIAIYYPFIRQFEAHTDKVMIKKVNQLVEVLQSEEETNIVTSLTGREDALGSVARMLASNLADAIEKKELFMLYQPQVNTEGKCIGAESLLRWNHPVVGFIYPPLIIRLAKESDQLSKLEEFIFDTAAGALSVIERETTNPCKISVNITNESLMWDKFEEMVDRSVKRHNVSRDRFWMEITEQDALSSSIDVINRLESLKKKGHKFLIDDFGMGHTSLLYLQSNSFEIVKIDGTIIKSAAENERYCDIIKSIVYLGNLLKFTTVAEFVETKEHVELLKSLGVNAFQGYYYSKPITLDELVNWINDHDD